MKRNWILPDTLIAIALILIFGAIWQYGTLARSLAFADSMLGNTEKPTKNYEYVCTIGGDFQALYYGETVHVHLSGGDFTLTQTTQTASSTAYESANGEVSLVVANGAATLSKNGVEMYGDCIPGVSNYS